jgi:hypothetical protein
MINTTGIADLMMTFRLTQALRPGNSGRESADILALRTCTPKDAMVTNREPRDRRRQPWAIATLALLVAFAVGACAFPEQGFDGSLDGTYYLNGFDQEGTEYGGSLTVTSTPDPDVYEMQWIITGAIQTGTGTVSGTQLLVDWESLEGFDTSTRGTAVYEITTDGELNGERRVDGREGFGTEEAFPIR